MRYLLWIALGVLLGMLGGQAVFREDRNVSVSADGSLRADTGAFRPEGTSEERVGDSTRSV